MSSSTGIIKAKCTWSDILYQTNKDTADEINDVLEAIVYCCCCYKDDIPPTDFIKEVRRCVRQFIINCLYYYITICDFCQSDINMCFHFNNNNNDDKPLLSTTTTAATGLNQIISELEKKRKTEPPYQYEQYIYPGLKHTYKNAELLNKKYIERVCNAHINYNDDDEPINKRDFNYTILYLMLHDKLKISVPVATSYIWNKFHLIDNMFEFMEKILICRHL